MPVIHTTGSEFMRANALPQPAIYLASQSPRRQQLLTEWGVSFELLLPDEGEDVEALEAVLPREAPGHYVRRVTRLKLLAALARLDRRGWAQRPVLCADTTVALGMDILGKPESAEHAHAMLRRLSGRSHRVLTAVGVGQGRELEVVVSRSWVHVMDLDEARIAAYVASGEPFGKAGAYGIQGLAALWVSHLNGSYSGVMGLPAHETGQILRRFGVSTQV